MGRSRAAKKQATKDKNLAANATKQSRTNNDLEWVESRMGITDDGKYACLACDKMYETWGALANHFKNQRPQGSMTRMEGLFLYARRNQQQGRRQMPGGPWKR